MARAQGFRLTASSEEAAGRLRVAWELAGGVLAVHDAEIARVPEEAQDAAERAAAAVEEFEAESRLTPERLKAGLRMIADRPRIDLDLAIADLHAKLSSGEELPVEDRDRLVDLVAAVRRVADLDVAAMLVERADALRDDLDFADRTVEESAERAQAARRQVALAERAAGEAERQQEACHDAGVQARGRLALYRDVGGLTVGEFEAVSRLLAEDLAAAEEAAQLCRDAAIRAERAFVDALAALDGKREVNDGGSDE